VILRGVDLTRLMVTLGDCAAAGSAGQRFSNITGGTDGLQGIEMRAVILGLFRLRHVRQPASSTR
jgi:branched-chain amino acid transport system permease protein